jgi:adenylyl-sulfate kinase
MYPIIWLTGLSGAGKTSLAQSLKQQLEAQGLRVQILDGDVLRQGLNADLGFTEADRLENIRRTAEVAKLFAQAGMVCLCALISPKAAMRQLARQIIGDSHFVEVFVDAPLALCQARDVKGLYAQVAQGELQQFTGIHQEYEPPTVPDLRIDTSSQSLQEATQALLDGLWPRLRQN